MAGAMQDANGGQRRKTTPVGNESRGHGSERAIYASAAIVTLIAAAATFWKGRIVYRHLLMREPAGAPADIVIILVAIAAIQIAYWSVLNRPPPFAVGRNLFLASVVLFLSRISFMLAGALFSIVVLVRLEELEISARQLGIFAADLFTIYCFSRWLELLGHLLESGYRPEAR
jgi:hypothetical protein